MKTIFSIGGAVAALILGSVSAHAATISASNGFGPVAGIASCKNVAVSAPFVTGQAVSGGDWTGGCVGFYSVDIDTVAKTITLTGLQIGNYESAFLDISGITEEVITGLAAIGNNNLFDPGAYGGGSASDVPTPLLAFTGGSMRWEWTSIGSASGQFAFGNGGSSVFSYTSRTVPVPEPASWALMLLAGLGMAGTTMRRLSR